MEISVDVEITPEEVFCNASDEEKDALRDLLFEGSSSSSARMIMASMETMRTEEVMEVYEYIVSSYHFDVYKRMSA